jgi:SSS family solute:Na+ symporter
VDERKLEAFYRRVRPGGWWGPIAARCPDVRSAKASEGWLGWFAGCVCIYAGLMGIGYLCLARYPGGLALLILAVASGWLALSRVAAEEEEEIL